MNLSGRQSHVESQQLSEKYKIAVLLKQIPDFLDLKLESHQSKLDRSSGRAKISSFCQRAIAKGVEVASQLDAELTLITMGPPRATEALQEAYAWAISRNVDPKLLLLCDGDFAGSDTLATAHTLARVLIDMGPFDLIFTGDRSLDSDTGQVPAQIAELIDLPLLAGTVALALVIEDSPGSNNVGKCLKIDATLDHSEVLLRAQASSPVIISCAERLCDPCKVDYQDYSNHCIESNLITITAESIGSGPWGLAISPTFIESIMELPRINRRKLVLSGDCLDELSTMDPELENQIEQVLLTNAKRSSESESILAEAHELPCVGEGRQVPQAPLDVLIVCDPYQLNRSLALVAQTLSSLGHLSSQVTIACTQSVVNLLGSAHFDSNFDVSFLVYHDNISARVLSKYLAIEEPAKVIVSCNTYFGRELAGRLSGSLNAGLTGGASSISAHLTADGNVQITCEKPDFGGDAIATIGYSSSVAIATMLDGGTIVMETVASVGERPVGATSSFKREIRTIDLSSQRPDTINIVERSLLDDTSRLSQSRKLICIGDGVDISDYDLIRRLCSQIDAELVCTRKVCDKAKMPRSRQVGITGRFVAPDLYIALGVSGRPSHLAGVRHCGTLVAFSIDPEAPIVSHADLTIVGDWRSTFIDFLARFGIT